MLTSEQSTLAQPTNNWPRYRLYQYLEENKIGQTGLPHLCKKQWPKMTQIFIRNNYLI